MSPLHEAPATSPPPELALPAPTTALLAQALDSLAWPLMLLRADGSLIHANLAARRQLRRGQALRLAPDRSVRPADPAHTAEFLDKLAATALHGPQQLRWVEPAGPVAATLSPLRGGDRAGAVPLLLALAAPMDDRAETRAFATLHGLSEAETRVLHRLALGESSSRAAAALGVAQATVRSQTSTLRRKTGHASVDALLLALARTPHLAEAAVPGE
jgi:DNA-binding CsgD family transcriptional regulator